MILFWYILVYNIVLLLFEYRLLTSEYFKTVKNYLSVLLTSNLKYFKDEKISTIGISGSFSSKL